MNKIPVYMVLFLVSMSLFTVFVQDTQARNTSPRVQVEVIEIPGGSIVITKVEYTTSFIKDSSIDNTLLSETWLSDGLYQTCYNGVEFKFLVTGPGNVDWWIYWTGGNQSNTPYCGAAQCHFTITTNWAAYYQYAQARVYNPQTIWGPENAYYCK